MLTKEFSAATDYTTVSPASAPKVWGKELGFVVGQTYTPALNSIVVAGGSKDSANRVPHASLVGSLTFPHSVTLEVSWLPYTPLAGGNIEMWGLGFKWTITDEHLKTIPIDVAIKVKYSGIDLAFPQTINNASTGNVPVDSNVEFQDSVLAAELYMSAAHSSGLLELYGALGLLQAMSRLSVSGAGSPSLSSSGASEMSSSPTSLQIILGANVYPLPFLDIGAELSRSFDRYSMNLKISAQF